MRKELITTSNDWFLNCIALVKRAPGMWVPTKSARELDLLFLGCMKARDDLGPPEYGANEAGLREEFQDWLCRKVGIETGAGWVYCLEQLDDRLVSLFEKFLATKSRAFPVAN